MEVRPLPMMKTASVSPISGNTSWVSGASMTAFALAESLELASKYHTSAWVSRTYLWAIEFLIRGMPLGEQKVLLSGHILASELSVNELAMGWFLHGWDQSLSHTLDEAHAI